MESKNLLGDPGGLEYWKDDLSLLRFGAASGRVFFSCSAAFCQSQLQPTSFDPLKMSSWIAGEGPNAPAPACGLTVFTGPKKLHRQKQGPAG